MAPSGSATPPEITIKNDARIPTPPDPAQRKSDGGMFSLYKFVADPSRTGPSAPSPNIPAEPGEIR
jgi:hypothetical protein